MSGRSTKSFIAEGRWEELEKQITRGDYVVIQFGHNDQKSDKERSTNPFSSYQSNLQYFVERTRAFEATPILLTSIARRHFDEDGNLLESHGEYPVAVRQLAEKLNVWCIDMLQLTRKALKEMGDEKSKEWFMWFEPNQHSYFAEGLQDNTHLQEKGAEEHAKLFTNELVKLSHPLATYLKKM